MCVLQMAQKQRQHSFELLTTNHISWFKFLLWVKSFPSGCPNHNPLMLGSFFFFLVVWICILYFLPVLNNKFVKECHDFGWVNFLCECSCGAVFWIFDGKSGDSILIFWLLQSSTYTDPKTFQPVALPCHWGAGGAEGAAGTQPGQLTQNDQREIPYHMMSCQTIKAEVKKEEEGERLEFIVSNGNICIFTEFKH